MKFKRLIPAFCLLLIAAIVLSTSTYAWFTMNRTVTATGMTVKARAEGGIVIKRTITSGAATETQVNFGSTTRVELLPTSTKDALTWYHAEAATSDNHTGIASSFETLTLTDTAPAAAALGTGTKGAVADGLYYYVYDSFTVTPDANSSNYTDLWVSQCSVASASGALSKSLRIAIVGPDGTVICAPVADATASYDVGNTGANNCTAIDTSASATQALSKAANNTVVSGQVTTAEIKVYAYFEGEDENHFTDNLTGLEDLTVTVKFTCTSVGAA